MSLNFGLYLVEQGVISCDQFCGLLKVQQLAVPSPASVAIRSNLLTVRQIGQVLNLMELNPGRTFVEAARSLGFLGADGQQQLEQEQRKLLPSLPLLLVECRLLTSRQVETMQRAFEKAQGRGTDAQPLTGKTAASSASQPNVKPAAERQSLPAEAAGPHLPAARRDHVAQPIRQPKFIQHHQVGNFEEAYYG